jgi:hypothetical protein
MKNRSRAISPAPTGKRVSGKSSTSGTPRAAVAIAKKQAMMSLDDWLRQPVRAFELIEAEEHGITVLELRQQFLRVVNAELRGPSNAYIN